MFQDHDDFATEPVKGLPEAPPEGEVILWQGRPDWKALTWASLSLPWVIGYFVVLCIWRVFVSAQVLPIGQAVGTAVPLAIVGALAVGLLCLIGWYQAKNTVYTVTNMRVAMRIGAALTMTLNLPFRQIGTAALQPGWRGTGTIAFDTLGTSKVSYLMLWPHMQPWHIRKPRPALRCIPDAANVAGLIAEAAETRLAMPEVARREAPASAAAAVAAE